MKALCDLQFVSTSMCKSNGTYGGQVNNSIGPAHIVQSCFQRIEGAPERLTRSWTVHATVNCPMREVEHFPFDFTAVPIDFVFSPHWQSRNLELSVSEQRHSLLANMVDVAAWLFILIQMYSSLHWLRETIRESTLSWSYIVKMNAILVWKTLSSCTGGVSSLTGKYTGFPYELTTRRLKNATMLVLSLMFTCHENGSTTSIGCVHIFIMMFVHTSCQLPAALWTVQLYQSYYNHA